jgi:hypothetical protein
MVDQNPSQVRLKIAAPLHLAAGKTYYPSLDVGQAGIDRNVFVPFRLPSRPDYFPKMRAAMPKKPWGLATDTRSIKFSLVSKDTCKIKTEEDQPEALQTQRSQVH